MDDKGQEEADLEAHRFDSFSWEAQKSFNLRYEVTEVIKNPTV